MLQAQGGAGDLPAILVLQHFWVGGSGLQALLISEEQVAHFPELPLSARCQSLFVRENGVPMT
jgi:hypothetical protein